MFDITSIINTQAIPVFLLPLNGLLCSLFYTRYFNINGRIHTLQAHLKDLIEKNHKESKTLKATLRSYKKELDQLHIRSKIILCTLVCLLISVITFCLCAILITLTVKFPNLFEIALTLWFLGPFMMIVGISAALSELYKSKKTLHIQSKLIESWTDTDDLPTI